MDIVNSREDLRLRGEWIVLDLSLRDSPDFVLRDSECAECVAPLGHTTCFDILLPWEDPPTARRWFIVRHENDEHAMTETDRSRDRSRHPDALVIRVRRVEHFPGRRVHDRYALAPKMAVITISAMPNDDMVTWKKPPIFATF